MKHLLAWLCHKYIVDFSFTVTVAGMHRGTPGMSPAMAAAMDSRKRPASDPRAAQALKK